MTLRHIVYVLLVGNFGFIYGFDWNSIDLPTGHISKYFTNNAKLTKKCQHDPSCPYKSYLSEKTCWGYESKKICTDKNNHFIQPICDEDHKGWVHSKEEQLELFYNQADFGFVKTQRKSLKSYCSSTEPLGSQLKCSDHLQFCKGQNIMIDFSDLLKRKDPVRYHMDVLKPGQILGNCNLDDTILQENLDQISPLQSWGPELRNFKTISTPIKYSGRCDYWIDTPTVITKIDAPVNMYHHFCDFFNLYASQHTNSSDRFAFSKDVQFIIWESYPYHSNFASAWEAFTNKPLWTLNKVAGKKICFKSLVFPLLPRMIFGLYYNTPLVWGCKNSGLFHSFSHHFLHRLRIPIRKHPEPKIHITFLSRQSTYRRVLNQNELLISLSNQEEYIVKKAEYSHSMDFKEQLAHDQWTDIFIGMHGAGLTHLLFLPDWAVLFELYNCGDPNCYKDLARLRGVEYVTWEDTSKLYPEDEGNHPEIGAHEKFTNYKFDVDEFLRLVNKAASKVKSHPSWQLKHKINHEEL